MDREFLHFIQDETIITEKIILFGSLINILENKEVGVANLLIYTLSNEDNRDIAECYFQMSLKDIFIEFFKRYPILSNTKRLNKLYEYMEFLS